MRTIAILPVKSFPVAKQRLREGLEPPQREGLAEAMFRDVLSSLVTTTLDEIIVVTASPAGRAIALAHGARVMEDREAGHNEAAALGIEAARARAADRVLLIPGDCPALDPEELEALLARPGQPPCALIVPDRHGTGTNALLLTPPDALEPSFGPGSCRRHLRLAQQRGTNVEVVEVPTLALDVDTPDDLDALTHNSRQGSTTRRLLSQLAKC